MRKITRAAMLPRTRRDTLALVGSVFSTAVLVGCLFAMESPRAEACSVAAPPPALVGYPTDGALDVPTDVVPVFDMSRISWTSSAFENWSYALSSEAGETIDLAARRSAVWHFELVPASALVPRTRYTLIAKPPADQPAPLSISFTTGAGSLAETPSSPDATMQHYLVAGNAQNTCDPPNRGTCISHPADGFVEELYLDLVNDPSIYDGTFGVQGPYFTGSSNLADLTGINQGTQFKCVRLRTRAANGTFSAPVQLCGKDAPTYDYPEGTKIACTATGLSPKGTLETSGSPIAVDPAGGPAIKPPATNGPAAEPLASRGRQACSVAGVPPSGHWAGLGLAGALLWLARTRARRALALPPFGS